MAIDEDGVIEEEIPKSEHNGILELGERSIECHFLGNGQRVFPEKEIMRYLDGPENTGLSWAITQVSQIPQDFLTGKEIDFLMSENSEPVRGYEASVLTGLCSYYAKALQMGNLILGWEEVGVISTSTIVACAFDGIKTLHDRTTGYEEFRKEKALKLKRKFFFLEEMADWEHTFPEEIWVELSRLKGIKYVKGKRPLYWSKITIKYFYNAIDPDIGKYLRGINPRPSHGKNHHQFLKKIIKDKLEVQIQVVIFMMKECKDWAEFKRRFEKRFGPISPQIEIFDFDDLDDAIDLM